MSIFKRFKAIAEAKANKVANDAENPAEMIELDAEKLLDLQRNAKRQLASVAGTRAGTARQLQEAQTLIAKLDNQAREALAQGNEALAQKALGAKRVAQSKANQFELAVDAVDKQQQNLEGQIRNFDSQLEDFKTRKEVMKARYAAANASVEINRAMSGIGEQADDVGRSLRRAEEKTNALEAESLGMQDLMNKGLLDSGSIAPRDEIQAELDAGGGASVDAELAAMKAELALGAPAPVALGSGSTTTTGEPK